MKLIICGNGFDLHHQLQTSYKCYKKYLEKNAPYVIDSFQMFPWFELESSSDRWADLEKTLKVSFGGLITDYEEICHDEDELLNWESDYLDITRFFYSFTGDEFFKWLSQAQKKYVSPDPTLIALFSNAVFINFNYTDTLERVYGISTDRILHVHGSLDAVDSGWCQGSDVIIYRGTDPEEHEPDIEVVIESDKWNSDVIREKIQFGAPITSESEYLHKFDDKDAEIQEKLKKLMEITTKPLYDNIDTLKTFLEDKVFDEIVLMGHSLGGADDFYYERVLIPAYKSARWSVFYYSSSDKESKETYLRNCGIKDIDFIKW